MRPAGPGGKMSCEVIRMRPIPGEYLRPASRRGRVERLDYGAKHVLVYLPDGAADRALYLIHGGGGDQRDFFCPPFLNMVDHMIEAGELRPLVIAVPTYYDPDETDKTPGSSGAAVAKFCPELRGEIIPLVERATGLDIGRDRRAIGGFSMGGVTTWYAFMEALDLFRWFLPLSGDCWACGEKGGGSHPEETARLLAEAAARQGIDDFRIHAVTGTADIAYPNLDAQIRAMAAYPDVFGPRLEYETLEGGVHDYDTIFRYCYNALPGLFRGAQ